MRFRSVLIGTVFLACSYLAATPEAEASFKKMSTVEMVDAADMIVRGTVVETWTEVGEHGRIWTRAQINIIESYKGAGRRDPSSWTSSVANTPAFACTSIPLLSSATVKRWSFSSTNFATVNYARSPCSPGNGPFVWTLTRKPKSSSDSRSKPEKSTTIGSFLFHHLGLEFISLTSKPRSMIG